jgi:L,D-transpeptidase ErfK/SrfK/L,D-transpeptidase YcfS
LEYYHVERGDSLSGIAEKYDIGLLNLIEANPDVDVFLPAPNTYLTLPTWLLLPNVPRKGIVVNLAELRLYYFPSNDDNSVYVFPIGIGRVGRSTPIMRTTISKKIKNPTWTPTKNIRKEYLQKFNQVLPQVIPAGPDNPLGQFALRLSHGRGEYLIHGTNKNFGIGLRVSSGCIRMRPHDIAWLYHRVQKGISVNVINRPVKSHVEPNGWLYVEAHQPLSQSKGEVGRKKVLVASKDLSSLTNGNGLAQSRLQETLSLQRGIPIKIRRFSQQK